MTAPDEEVLAALRRIPLLADVAAAKLSAERLGGLTNRNYKITAPGGHYVMRIPGEKTGDYINRKVEAHNAKAAAAAGVNAEVLFFDASDGLMLCRFIEGCLTMSPALFMSRPGAPARAARALRQMHRSGKSFEFRERAFRALSLFWQ
jgi:aminoglycoside phosphotransferase (APT) family kinase protein